MTAQLVQALDALTPSQLSDQIRECAQQFESLRYSVGYLLNEADRQRAWVPLGFPSKGEWLNAILPSGMKRSSAYMAARQVREHPQLPPEEFASIPSDNLDAIKYLPERKRTDPTVLEQAKEMEAGKFKQWLNEKYSLHLTPAARMVFKFADQEMAQDVEKGLQNYIKTNGGSREEAVWHILGDTGWI